MRSVEKGKSFMVWLLAKVSRKVDGLKVAGIKKKAFQAESSKSEAGQCHDVCQIIYRIKLMKFWNEWKVFSEVLIWVIWWQSYLNMKWKLNSQSCFCHLFFGCERVLKRYSFYLPHKETSPERPTASSLGDLVALAHRTSVFKTFVSSYCLLN